MTSENRILSLEDYFASFLFQDIRPNHRQVLQEKCEAFSCGYKIIVLEAPTGLGKRPVDEQIMSGPKRRAGAEFSSNTQVQESQHE